MASDDGLRAERVLIIDWDVHHGNGTQDVFYDDGSVFFVSLHQAPHYPGTGGANETGTGVWARRYAERAASGGHERGVVSGRASGRTLDAVSERFTPDFVLMSAGFDCMAGDPLGGFLLEPSDIHWMTRQVIEISASPCDGRVVGLLEGGYDPKRLGLGAVALIRALAGLSGTEG